MVGGGTVKVSPLEVDLDKDVKLDKLKTLIKQAAQGTDKFRSSLSDLEKFKKALSDLSDKKSKQPKSTDEATKKKLDAEVEKATDEVEKATAEVKTQIELHKKTLEDAVEEWKLQSRPLKNADKLIQEWEDDVADDKADFPASAKSAIQSELIKIKNWSLPLTKYRMALSTALKDSSINKKFTEALDSVLAGKGDGSKGLADSVDEWTKSLTAQLTGFEREIKKSAVALDASVKKIIQLAGKKS